MNGLKKMYTYTMEYYLATRKEGILPFPTTWMDLENITLRDISHTERQILYGITYMTCDKKNTVNV